MKFLHTSDWHLGRTLYGRKRYTEFSAFLDWLTDTIITENIDVLLVAGDIFDTNTPSNRAQELYYQFLCRVSTSCCQHIIIIAGNHDSPSFLNAPKKLLRALNVHVVGAISETNDDEIIIVENSTNSDDLLCDKAIICAVPYLRDRDIRTVEAGESSDTKNSKLALGIKNHYAEVVTIAINKRTELLDQIEDKGQLPKIPIIAMGHLFTAGGKTVDGDGVRELYIGSLAYIGVDTFPPEIDYLALGHLHVPQCVGNTEHIRYSGSPLPMGYGEAKQTKSIVIFSIDNDTTTINEVTVPRFQELERITGDADEIETKIKQLKARESLAWLEIEYTGKEVISNLREKIDEIMIDSKMEIRRIKNQRVMDQIVGAIDSGETLDNLDVTDVFERCLNSYAVPIENRSELLESYQEIIKTITEEDVNES